MYGVVTVSDRTTSVTNERSSSAYRRTRLVTSNSYHLGVEVATVVLDNSSSLTNGRLFQVNAASVHSAFERKTVTCGCSVDESIRPNRRSFAEATELIWLMLNLR